MIRLAIASCFVVLLIAGSASAGIWDAMTVSYPTTHINASSEYVTARGVAGYGGQSGFSTGNYASSACCGKLWSNYCAERPITSCRPQIHSRYHWFAKPSCGCGVQTAMPCCGDYPMCGCNHDRMIKGCGSACPSCLGMHVRGFWNRCHTDRGCGSPTCESCGGATEIINLEESMQPSVPEVVPAIEPTPAKATEARLMPSLQALLPRN